MISRRTFCQAAAGAWAAAAITPLRALTPSSSDEFAPLQWVDLRIGTGGHGHCFPGASLPFGAVQLSPDTYNEDWDWCSGYHISDSSIMGFSHTHLSGTGCGDLLDFLVMAGTGPVRLQPGNRSNLGEGYRSRFSHSDEIARPGFYQVFLADPKVKVELTATERTGLHRYTFPKSDGAWLIVDLSHSYADHGHSQVVSAELERPAPDTLAGGHITKSWGPNRQCFFHLQVSRPPDKVEFYNDDRLVSDTAAQKGSNLKAVLHYKTRASEPILVRVGISGVSAEGAAKNLSAEQPDWNFERTRRNAEDRWRAQLSRIRVQMADPAQQRIFYTGLYHLSLGPSLFDDVDGHYRGMDGAVHELASGQRNYTTFSLWDTFRAAHPAYTLFQQDRVPDFANSLIHMAEQSPDGMPVWPLQGTETGTMTGYHSASVIAEAIHKGFPNIDIESAYRCMMKRAMVDDYRGLGLYRQMGYIPADREPESVSKTFEYCYNDWAIA
ncbi:MAG TPA: GH92 family glycosyl hydrolase, partial [Bryobacteraceae bacterium]